MQQLSVLRPGLRFTVPAKESDLFKSVKLEPRLILFLDKANGGRSTTLVQAVAPVTMDLSAFPVLANDDESDLDIVRRVPTIIGNTAVNLIRLLDKKPPPPPPPFGESMFASETDTRTADGTGRRILIHAHTQTHKRKRVHDTHTRERARHSWNAKRYRSSWSSSEHGINNVTIWARVCCTCADAAKKRKRTGEKYIQKKKKHRTVGGRYHTLCRRTWPFNYLVYTACCGW